MSRGLDVLSRLCDTDDVVRSLHGEPFRLAVEKPNGWVPSLLIELVQREFDAAKDLRRDHNLGITLGVGERLTQDNASAWGSSVCTEAKRIIDAMRTLINDSANALAKGDATGVIYAARHIGRMYREALEWSARVRRVHAPAEWRQAYHELGTMMNEFFAECDEFVPRMRKQFADARANQNRGPVMFSFTFRVPEMKAYFEELRKIANRRGISLQPPDSQGSA